MLHAATIKKSRVWALNGQAFTWKDQKSYKPGYYKVVAEAFQPHFETINIGGVHHVTDVNRPSSDVLFVNGSDQSWYETQLKREIAFEKWDTTIAIIAGGQTKDAIRMRQIIGESITGTRSKTEFQRTTLEQIEKHLAVLLASEKRLKAESPKDDTELIEQIKMAKEEIEHPGKSSTLLEVMLHKSVESVKANGHAVAEEF